MSIQLTVVITTIQNPTRCVSALAEHLCPLNAKLIIVGDKKGPSEFPVPSAELVTLDQQLRLPLRLSRHLPTGHYVRKNIGYLLAIQQRTACIYETDDDNMPGPTWQARTLDATAQPLTARKWVNVFRLFSDQLIWPRGFPLDLITDKTTYQHDAQVPTESFAAPIQQGLADLSPDVDAVWRLTLDHEFHYKPGPSIWIPPGAWCPFNSQSTWWWPVAYPLMYLPSYCTFRMTDIWRSFVAQRCLWELGNGLVYHAPEVIQERNPHRLIKDFEDEVPGYLQNQHIVQILENLTLASGPGTVGDNLIHCYEALVAAGIFPAAELDLIKAWLADLESPCTT